MQYQNLGKSGLKISRIGLGMMSYGSRQWRKWVLEEDTAQKHIRQALDLGINFFDTANMYSLGVSEEITGKALKKLARREEVVIATKVYFRMHDGPLGMGLSRKHILDQAEASLRRLKTDYIDLYQIHRWDYETPIEETLEALHDLIRSGKVRYIGASSMYAWQFCKSLYLADLKGWTRFVSMQNHYNLVYREEEREMNPLCEAEGIGLLPWSPLARGLLSGSRRGKGKSTLRNRTDKIADQLYTGDQDAQVVDALIQVAEAKNSSPAIVALSWLLQRPNVTAPIIGTTKIKHLKEAVKALELELTEEDIATLEHPYRPNEVRGHQ